MRSVTGTVHRGRMDRWWEAADLLATCPGSRARHGHRRAHPRVVVAKADGEERRRMETALHRDGCEVVPVSDGVAALELLCEVGPDVIIADLDGRDLDGLLLCRVRGSLVAHATLPVLVLTGAGPDATPARAMLSLGNVRVMQKPADPAAVAAAISQMVRIVPAARPGPSAA